MITNKRVCVVGLGYIGLPTAALLANRGFEVHGVDVNPAVVETINQGNIHIVEPELDTFVKAAVSSGRLKAWLKPTPCDVYMIAVPTPFHEGFVPNIDYVLAATRSLSAVIKPGDLVILESTSPVGTCRKIEAVLREEGIDTSQIHFAYCPERVLPGNIMRELVENDRVVGGLTPEASQQAKNFYQSFVSGEILVTNSRTAEMVKLTENSFRDLNIAFANEISMICEEQDINVWELIRLANHHPRVNILQPGVGVGGHCIAVDPWFIVSQNPNRAKIIRTAREVNDYKTEWIIEKVKLAAEAFEAGSGRKARIACMGLAFKPNIDDLRESRALYLTRQLISFGMEVLACEPNVESFSEFPIFSPEEAVENADIVVFLVAHRQFLELGVPNGKPSLDFCGVRG